MIGLRFRTNQNDFLPQNKIKGDTALTLEQCLEHYTKAETLSAEDAWRCPHCQKYLPVVKTLGLWSLPDILVIHFKRFRQQHTKGPQSAKLTTTVQFPLTNFDMSPHLARDTANEKTNANGFMTEDNWSPWRKLKRKDLNNDLKNNRYDLYAVCYHQVCLSVSQFKRDNSLISFALFSPIQGDTLETGHYTAACKNPYDHQWYKFDDQRVAVVPNDRVQEDIVNNEAYILFYQRRNVDSAECSGSNSSSSGEHWVSKMCTSAVTLSSDPKKDEVEKPDPKTEVLIEKSESKPKPTIVAVQSDKNVQTDDECKTEKQVEVNADVEKVPANDEGASKSVAIKSTMTDVPVKVEPTNEDEIVDVIGLDVEKSSDVEPSKDQTTTNTLALTEAKEAESSATIVENTTEENIPVESSKINDVKENIITNGCGNSSSSSSSSGGASGSSSCSSSNKSTAIHSPEIDIDIEVELRNMTVKKSDGALSVSFPTQRSLWPFENHHNTIHTYTPILSRGSLNFNELLANERNAHLRHSLSTTLGHQRNSNAGDKAKGAGNDTLAMVRGVSSCSKDTLLFVDQQTHRHRSIMDEEFMANQPLWV